MNTAGLAANQKLQLGDEATPGTAVAADFIWRGVGGLEDGQEQVHIPEKIGIAVPTNRIALTNLLGMCKMDATPATFEQLPYLGMAGIKSVTGVQDGAGSDYVYTFPVGMTSVNTIMTYTIEGGDDKAMQEMEYAFLTDLTISGRAKELVQMSGNWVGRQLTDSTFTGSLSVPAVDEVQAPTATLYIDNVSGAFGTTAKAAGGLLDFSLKYTTGWGAKFAMNNSGNLYFVEAVFDRDKVDLSLDLTFRHVTDAKTERQNWQAQTPRLIELEFQGPSVTTPGTTYSYKMLRLQVAGVWDKFDALGSDAGDSTIKGTFKGGYDETAAEFFTMIVVNELSALP